jgi:hypothetical protein
VRRPAAAWLAGLLVALSSGCGGTEEETLESLWRAPGADLAVTPGTSDYAVGTNRVSFLVVDNQSRLVERPTARVWIARGLKEAPFAETTARLEPVGVPGGDDAGVGGIYVARIETPTAGTYWLLAEPVGGRKVQALGNVVVRERSKAPAVGDRAIASRTPTLSSTNGDLATLTTSRRPDRELYEVSVAQALAAHEAFVVSFATPQFCQSRTCGPTVDVLSAVRKRMAGSGVRFIHVEVYADNDPAKGVNGWMRQWRLPTEPFTFVVDRRGVIRAKLEGAFSVAELAAAARAVSR